MICIHCNEIKLSNEFSLKTGRACFHPSLWCLQCCVESISNQSCCPECNRSLSNLDILSLHSQLNIISQNEQFHIMDTLSSSPPPSPSFSGHVMVTMLNGSSFKLAYHPSTSVLDFQKRLENVSGVKVDNQKLVYQNVDLNAKGKKLLREYKIIDGSSMQLMNIICAIPSSSLNKIVFDLNWGYPEAEGILSICLDGTCFVFNDNRELMFLIDFCNKTNPITSRSIVHSGDIMDDEKRQGHQIINIALKELPLNVSSLYFVLSAYATNGKITDYGNPTVTLFNKSKPSSPLISATIHSSTPSKALVMCSLTRVKEGWRVLEIGKACNGNAKDYHPIISVIESIM